jgi:hypothetical protein
MNSSKYFRSAVSLVAFLPVIMTGQRARMPADTTGPTTTPTTFKIQSFDGSNKCLDYSTSGANPSVFLNDCQYAHPITVQEINSRHQVILHAGANQVIGIKKTVVGLNGSAASATTAPTQYPLQLLTPSLGIISPTGAIDDVFTLDGDSIILESSRPCVTTDTASCAAPPTQLVVQIPDGVELDSTPLIVAPRNLADSEFWDFVATDSSARFPTSGFVSVATNYDLWNAVCASPVALPSSPPSGPCTQFAAAWGTVIEVGGQAGTNVAIDLSSYPPLILPAGVTLRGGRRGTNIGSQLKLTLSGPRDGISPLVGPACDGLCMIQIHGDYVRVTGLLLTGQSRTTEEYVEQAVGVWVDSHANHPMSNYSTLPTESSTQYIAMVDHNELSDWESAGVRVEGGHERNVSLNSCPSIDNDQNTQANVLVTRNFMHHNTRNGDGYGTVIDNGGRARILGNIFWMNRHAIAGDGEPHDEYQAWYNFVLSTAPVYDNGWFGGKHEQDFDMHGTAQDADYFGGLAGTVDIAGNTFLGNNRPNFSNRGKNCYISYFRDNVTQHVTGFYERTDGPIDMEGADGVDLVFVGPDTPASPVTTAPYVQAPAGFEVEALNNQYGNSSTGYLDPTASLRVGDFDGDGLDDVFLATGTAWYFSPAAVAEWRLLSPKTEKPDALLLGDFDGDGRTDVVKKSGNYLMVSWGGTSDWELLNSNPTSAQIADMAVGNFSGDAREDIFWADGQTWWVSDHGAAAFVRTGTSSFRVPNLRFGDFTGRGQTDVFSVVGGRWQVRYRAASIWTPLPVSLPVLSTDSVVGNIVVADFTGDGRADIATSSLTNSGYVWQISGSGATSWETHTILPNLSCPDAPLVTLPPSFPAAPSIHSWPLQSAAAIGHFTGKNAAVGTLVWTDNQFCMIPGGGSSTPWAPSLRSLQDMR